MRSEKLGSLEVVIGGGTDRRGGGEGPLVVLLHGYGATGDDLVPLSRVLDVRLTNRAPTESVQPVRYVFPAAPLALDHFGGRAWWLLDEERIERSLRGEIVDRSDEVPEGMAGVRAQILECLAAVEEKLHVAPEKVVLGGFSQGSMVTMDVALQSERAFAGLVLMSSTLLAAREWVPRMASRKGLPIFQSHGSADALLPYRHAEALRDKLLAAGAAVEWHSFSGGHEIPPSVIDALGSFLGRVL